MHHSDDLLFDCYKRMMRIRLFELTAVDLFRGGELPGFIHPSVGQEAVSVGLTYHLRSDDYLTSNHRGHGHIIGKGAQVDKMFAELYGRQDGYCHGRGGSMHIIDTAVGILGANGIVGGGLPIAVGAALATSMDGRDAVTVAFFGDGSVNIGSFHEALNLAAIWKLPCIFVCENNQYAESTPFHTMIATDDLLPRAAGYGMAGLLVDGNDIDSTLTAAETALERARSGGGPTLIQADTYRWFGHHTGDTGPYRTDEEVAQWKGKDPILRLRKHLEGQSDDMAARCDEADEEARTEVQEGVEFGRQSPEPSPETVFDNVYSSQRGVQ